MSKPELNIVPRHYNDGGYGDEPPMSLEPRVARIESDVEYIKRDIAEIKTDLKDLRDLHHRDFRITFSAIISTALALAALLAKGFNWI
ncbi:hypothetical protein VAEKB19_810001 [Vibrio aestuarianus]|nr:hypothetical protein VAEKB19_810001 [Vibrio aestuarianus]